MDCLLHFFIMGEEKAADFWRKHKDDFDAILMSDNGTLYVTEGLENDFQRRERLRLSDRKYKTKSEMRGQKWI